MKSIVSTFLLSMLAVSTVCAQGFSIKGTVKDASTRQAAEYINVVLQTPDSAFVQGAITNRKGRFAFQRVVPGDYRLSISCVGYHTRHIDLAALNEHTDLGEIWLSENTVAIDGVTIQASGQVSLSDRKLIFPSQRQIKLSTNGINLLQQLMLPRVKINPINQAISLSGDGELQLRINGAQAELEEIRALRPTDIVRIEYHDNPSLRYGEAEAVIDYIVRRPETGGDVGADLSQGANTMWGEYNVFGKINRKHSMLGVSYNLSLRDFYSMYRDNAETLQQPDGSILSRYEKGEPSQATLIKNNLNVKYSLQPDPGTLFNASFRLKTNHSPHWDYRGVLIKTTDPQNEVNMIDLDKQNDIRPSLDLYFQKQLPHEQWLALNVVGTYTREASHRQYRETRGNQQLTDVSNKVQGDKYSIIGEAIYEKRLPQDRTLGFGLRHTQSFANHEYRNGSRRTADMDQGNTYAYAEWKGKVKKLDYRLGVGVTRSYHQQQGKASYMKYGFNPRIMLHYAWSDDSFIRWKADISNASPSLGNLTDVDQRVDSFQIRRGNPLLESFLRYRTELTYEWRKGLFYTNIQGSYDYQPNAIMDEKYPEGDYIVQTWNNQKDWQKLSGRLTLRVGPIKDRLQLSVTGGVNHYISHGNTYSHTYTNWFVDMEVSFNYKQFSSLWQMYTNQNRFFGETLSGGENMQVLGVFYTHKNWRLGVSAFNPFTNNYKLRSENRNRFASYKKNVYFRESSQAFIVSLSYNLSFGRRFKTAKQRISNSDNESGVMQTGK